MPRESAAIQYVRSFSLKHDCLWNKDRPVSAPRKASSDFSMLGRGSSSEDGKPGGDLFVR
jgi:hypothetical protein